MTATRRDYRRGRRAFTLVELLVVIGIIAVLIAILLPVLSRSRDAAKGVACLSNLRSSGQASIGYTSDNDGVMPIGSAVFGDARPRGDAAPGTNVYVRWYTLLNAYMGGDEPRVEHDNGSGRLLAGANYGDRFRCAGVDGEFAAAGVQFFSNPAVMPDQDWDVFRLPAFNGYPLRGLSENTYAYARPPAKLSQMYGSETLLFFDGSLASFMRHNEFPVGAPSNAFSGIDAGWMMTAPAYENFFYRGTGEAKSYEPAWFTNNPQFSTKHPVAVFGPDTADRVGIPLDRRPLWPFNADYISADGTFYLPIAGAPVFRHAGRTSGSAVFGDGSARGMKLYPNKPHPYADEGAITSDYERRHLRIKFPSRLPGR